MNAIINLLIWAASVAIAFSVVQLSFYALGLGDETTGLKKFASITAKVFFTLILWPYITWAISVILSAATGLSTSHWEWLKVFLAVAFSAGAGVLITRGWNSGVRDAVVVPATAIIDAVAVCMILAAFGINATSEIDGSLNSWMPTVIMVALLSWLSVGFKRPAFLDRFITWGMVAVTFVIALTCADLVYLQASGKLTKTALTMQHGAAEAASKVNAEAEGRLYDEFATAQVVFQAAELIYNADPTDENYNRYVEAATNLNAVKNKPIKKIDAGLPPAVKNNITAVGGLIETIDENGGVIGGSAKTAWRVAFGKSAPGPTPPPRNTEMLRQRVSKDPARLLRVYNGDKFEYWSPKDFKIVEMRNGVQTGSHIHNQSNGGEKRFFSFYDLPAEGIEAHIVSLDGSEFEMEFQVTR